MHKSNFYVMYVKKFTKFCTFRQFFRYICFSLQRLLFFNCFDCVKLKKFGILGVIKHVLSKSYNVQIFSHKKILEILETDYFQVRNSIFGRISNSTNQKLKFSQKNHQQTSVFSHFFCYNGNIWPFFGNKYSHIYIKYNITC